MSERLLDRYDALLLDLDGTVYRGGQAVPGAAETVRATRDTDTVIRFVTNNASRSTREVAQHLTDLGVPCEPIEVSTSAQAAAAVLAGLLTPGSEVLVVGTDALADIISSVDLRPVRTFPGGDRAPAAVVQGISQQLRYADLTEACLAIRAGALWVACNIDATLPTERGELPGNGAMVAALRTATGREPVVAGKPERPLLDEAIRSAGAHRPLFVGDRLDTDIAGAHAVDIDALLVFTGVTTPAELLAAPRRLRPRYLAEDLTAVLEPAEELEIGPHPGWTVRADGDALTISAQSPGEPITLLRALCAAHQTDEGGAVELRAEDDITRKALAALGLA